MASTNSLIERAFWEFHDANPHVYQQLVELSRRLVARGRRRIGMKMLFEVLRWHYAMTTAGDADGFKLNNNYHALYARLIMAREDDLAGVFEIRRLRAAEPFGQLPDPVAPVGHVAPPRVVHDLPDAETLF